MRATAVVDGRAAVLRAIGKQVFEYRQFHQRAVPVNQPRDAVAAPERAFCCTPPLGVTGSYATPTVMRIKRETCCVMTFLLETALQLKQMAT
jgi:hypothetical protein